MKLDAGREVVEQEAERRAGGDRREHAAGCWRRGRTRSRNAAAMIAQTPAARPSTPSEKLTTFIITTSPITVSTGRRPRARVGERQMADERQRDRLHGDAVVHDDHRREHLAEQLDRGVQVEAVVERADERDQRRPRAARRATAAAAVRWRSRRAARSGPRRSAPAKIARPPSSGVGAVGQPALARLVDRADAPSRSAS